MPAETKGPATSRASSNNSPTRSKPAEMWGVPRRALPRRHRGHPRLHDERRARRARARFWQCWRPTHWLVGLRHQPRWPDESPPSRSFALRRPTFRLTSAALDGDWWASSANSGNAAFTELASPRTPRRALHPREGAPSVSRTAINQPTEKPEVLEQLDFLLPSNLVVCFLPKTMPGVGGGRD